MKKFLLLSALCLSIFRTASAQTPTPTINGVPPPFIFTGPGVSQTGQTLTFTGTGTGLGSVTVVVPAVMAVSPATLTTAGTFTFSFANETANTVFAGPVTGSAAAPTFRALVNADIPTTLTGITIDGVTPTVMGYVDPTSSIQTQLNGKQCTLTLTTTGTSGASTLTSCVLNIPQYSGGGGTPGGSSGQFQYNNSSSFGGVADLTYSTHTISGISTTIFDLSAATGTAAFKVPVYASNTATAAGVIDFDSTANHYHVYDSGADDIICTKNNSQCPGGGSVTTVSIVTANGVSGTVATATTTPAITLTLGAITPSSVSIPGDGTHAAQLSLYPNTTAPTLTSGNFSLLGPNASSVTAFAWQFPTATNSSAGILHVGANSGAVSQLTTGLVVGADMTNNTVTATQLAAQYSKGSCTEAWGGSGTSHALASGDDAVVNNACYNDSGVTRTITAVKCRNDNASNTTTVNPTFGSAGTGTTILSGALTCGNSYAYSSSGTVSNASWTTGTGIDPAMAGSLTGTSISMIVEYTF